MGNNNYAIPEIDNYLDVFGTFGAYKSDPDDPAPILPKKGRTLKLRDHDFKVKAKREERAQRLAKKAKDAKSWENSEIDRPDGTENRFYWAETFKHDDGVHIAVRTYTERKPAIRVRKANSKIAEIEKEGRAIS